MEKEVVKNHHHSHHSHSTSNNNITSTSTSNLRERHVIGDGLIKPPQSSDFVLRWGNRKRLRCMKIQVKNETIPASRTTVRVDRRVIRSEGNTANNSNGGAVASSSHAANGHFNLRQRPASPAQPPPRLLRHNNTEGGSTMKGLHINHNNNNNNMNNGNSNNNYNQSNGGGIRGLASPDRGEKKGGGAHHAHEINGGGGRTASSETKNGTSSGGANDVIWPPKFMIALTNKEKEEDFMAIKGSKLPQRPKKRAKFIQRTLNLVSPGGWLGDLTLERYEVREKKISKKRPRGLKAMGNYMDSDSD